jgi:glutamine synthetase
LFLVLGGGLERTQTLGPEDLEVSPELGDGFRPRAIQAFRPVPSLGDQARLLQDAQVLGDGRPGDVEAAGDLTDRELLARDESKDLAAAGLTECGKSVDILRVSARLRTVKATSRPFVTDSGLNHDRTGRSTRTSLARALPKRTTRGELEMTLTIERPATAAPAVPKTSAKDVLKLAKEQQVKIVDLRFVDLPGTWQHFSIPVEELSEGLFSDGIGFDGSSIRGFQHIHESDMLLLPDATSVFIDPVLEVKTLDLICDVVDPITRKPYTRDPRYVARKAEEFLPTTGIADTSFWGPEIEFYIFNSLRFDQAQNFGYYYIDSEEGIWNSGQNGTPNLAHRPRYKEGYFPVPPADKLQDVRSKMVRALIDTGIAVEVHHHEVGTAGQTEIDMRFSTLVEMADRVLKYKYVTKNVAAKNGYVVTFMPKPLFGDNGSGMHTHQSLWKNGSNLFYDRDGYALLSTMARHYIGGLLKHAPAILAFAAPTTNSYRRLVPGYEAPINLVYSMRNRSACVRIPTYFDKPEARRLEFRAPDPSCNPYLSFSACLMAGLDGVINQIEPPAPMDVDLYELEAEAKKRIKQTPGSLEEVLDALDADRDFLMRGDVFTDDLIEAWLSIKRQSAKEVALRPHPYEFYLYSDV